MTMDRLDTAFYSPIAARSSGTLALDVVHTMYYEETGNPEGPPVVVLHGGPGGGIRPYYRQLLDPRHFRGIFYDQRGCGQSTPFGSLDVNTTWHLVEDLEKLRRHLGVERWLVFGGSWGSALGLAYAETHPASCIGLIVTGIFLARRVDQYWWWEGVRFVYPEVWAALRDALPPDEQDDLRGSYIRRVMDPDPAIHEPAALAIMKYESQTLDVWPNQEFIASLEVNPSTLAMGRIFTHYDRNDFFFNDGQLIDNADRLRGLPGFILGGRFDMCTPPRSAWDLAQAWPDAKLQIVPVAGHRWNDEMLGRAIVSAIEAFKNRSWR